jgi:MEDS: MEthanogen/methylotroph, DcmR Sensory domain
VGTLTAMDGDWVDFLRDPGDSGHAAQVYADVEELAESVAGYLATGFANGDPAIVIATRAHRTIFARCLAATGWDSAALTASRLLTLLDAHETLARFDDGDRISTGAFEQTVGGAIDTVAERFPGRSIRAFGEMVDVLVGDGRHAAAAELEELWNELARTRRFSLLCGYRLDIFDRSAQVRVLPAVCAAHTHVRPAYDSARLDRAVYDALDEVLGSSSARMVHGIVTDKATATATPVAEQMLLWISDRMPRHADRVLAVAREKYASSAVRVS